MMNIEEGKGSGVTSGHPFQFKGQGYQAGPVNEGRPASRGQDPLPCGCGIGWLLFILGFFFGVIPWFAGAIMLLCVRDYDSREKPGLVACAIGAVIATIFIIVIVVIKLNN